MRLKNVDPTEFSEMYNNSFEPKQKVNKEAVQNIIGEFVYSGIFIMEVVLSEDDRTAGQPLRQCVILSA